MPIRTQNHKLNAASPTFVLVGVASGTLVATNPIRACVMLVNLSNQRISLAFGAHAAVLDSGVTLQPGDVFYMDDRTIVEDQINAIASGSSARVSIQEWSIT